MTSLSNPDSWVSTTQWGKSDGTTNTTIEDIRKAIDDEFNNNVRIFMVNKYSGSRMTVQPQKQTKPTETRSSTPSPQMGSQKTNS